MDSIKTLNNRSHLGAEFDPIPINKHTAPVRTRFEIIQTVSSLGQKSFGCIPKVTDEELEAEFSNPDLPLDLDVSPKNITDKDLEMEFGIVFKKEFDQSLRGFIQKSDNTSIQSKQKASNPVDSELINRFARLRGVDSTRDPRSKILSRPAPKIETGRPMINQVRKLHPNIQEAVGRSIPLPVIPEKSFFDRAIFAMWG
jgi:hypothetical protein